MGIISHLKGQLDEKDAKAKEMQVCVHLCAIPGLNYLGIRFFGSRKGMESSSKIDQHSRNLRPRGGRQGSLLKCGLPNKGLFHFNQMNDK